MPNKILQIKNLTTEFTGDNSSLKAVDGVSFSIEEGEIVGVVGESGSGKSVTSLSAMGLIPSPPGKITQGEILFTKWDGTTVDTTQRKADSLRSIRGNEMSMIFQEPMTSLNPVFSCGDQVAETIVLHQKLSGEEAKTKTLELFKKVELPRPDIIFDQYPHQLSGGQKQRVMIAMAISCNPKLLIADEPTTALDVTVQKTILELLKNLQKETKMGILFITHDLGVVAELAHKVVVMYKGKIVEQGSVSDIFNNPKHPYTKGLISCRPPLNVRYSKLPTVPDFMETGENGEIKSKLNSISEYLSNITVSKDIRKKAHEKLYLKSPLLSVYNLKTYFPINKNFLGKTTSWVKAVDDVSFDVFPGETLGLIGESGCGKTTTGRSIVQLVPISSGKITYKGQDVYKMNKKEMSSFRKDVQIIFQDPYSSLNPRQTIGKSIVEPMEVHKLYATDKERKQQALKILTKVGLKESDFNKYPHQFSGGQRQRVCIARTLAMEPKFIICDESVSALDVSVQAQVLNLLNDLKKDFGLTYIFISHDLSVIKYMCDRMVVMNKRGKIERYGECDEIYEDPQTEYTKSLIDAIPKINTAE
ncbi:MAG: ABC transporter ATP-binding protein [Flavobacteriales bacterium]|nr:ABC transporter ATP-binding protein [Flavobacteriales bacterium]MBO72128.1 ABC transporter ATP-binding protein [Flavobacteriales bacterium]|tara:strand:+ start:32039 stop:33802 length:1764 start_codon:yes stop_codon:yes gene_type:complete